MNPIGAQRYGNPDNNRIKSTAKMVKNMKFSLQQLQALNAQNLLNEEQKNELAQLEAAQVETTDEVVTDNLAELVTPHESMIKLNGDKIALYNSCGYELPNPEQALLITLLSHVQCLAADQETTVVLRTHKDHVNAFAQLYGATGFRTTLHNKLTSTEACWTAKGLPFFNTMGMIYTEELSEYFRTATDEDKRGSQFMIAPSSLLKLETGSKVFLGIVDIELNKTTDSLIDWHKDKTFNRAKNNIDSDQFDLVQELRPKIKDRISKMMQFKLEGMNDAVFEKYAFILAVASFLDLESFKVILKMVHDLAAKTENGDLEAFKTSLAKVVEAYQAQGQANISTHTLAAMISDTEFGSIGLGRVNTYLEKLDLRVDTGVRCFNIPTSGLAVATITEKLEQLKVA